MPEAPRQEGNLSPYCPRFCFCGARDQGNPLVLHLSRVGTSLPSSSSPFCVTGSLYCIAQAVLELATRLCLPSAGYRCATLPLLLRQGLTL